MKNKYIDQIIDEIQDGKKVSAAKRELAYAYQQPAYTMYGMICLDNPIHKAEDAAAIAQNLSLAGINDLYITRERSNQLGSWLALDCFGLKLRGIVSIDNADYRRDIERWGSSDRPETIPALKFSFKEAGSNEVG